MSSKQNINTKNLRLRIEQSGIILPIPCHRCAVQGKVCIKSEISSRCSECVGFGRCKCRDMASSDLAWKKLIKAQEKIEADDDRLNAELEALLAKRARLHKQRKLLRKRAGEFIQTDIKDVEELERLEEKEEEERKREAELQKSNEMIAAAIQEFPVSSNNEFDHVLSEFLSGETLESFRGSSNA